MWSPNKQRKWDRRFLEMCQMVGSWSKDPSTKCGAVITESNRVLSVGYNGLASGVMDSHERYTNRDVKLQMILHAERNAIDHAPRDLAGSTLYCSAFPCAQCAASICGKGIKRVVALINTDYETRYAANIRLSREMFQEAKIQWERLPVDIKNDYPADAPRVFTLLENDDQRQCGSCDRTHLQSTDTRLYAQCESCLGVFCPSCKQSHVYADCRNPNYYSSGACLD